jgi:hypothetical protein
MSKPLVLCDTDAIRFEAVEDYLHLSLENILTRQDEWKPLLLSRPELSYSLSLS